MVVIFRQRSPCMEGEAKGTVYNQSINGGGMELAAGFNYAVASFNKGESAISVFRVSEGTLLDKLTLTFIGKLQSQTSVVISRCDKKPDKIWIVRGSVTTSRNSFFKIECTSKEDFKYLLMNGEETNSSIKFGLVRLGTTDYSNVTFTRII